MSVTANSTKLTITGVEPDINTIVIDGVTYDISDYDGTLASIGSGITVSNVNVFVNISVSMTATLGLISYGSQNTVITLDSSINANATLGLISYNSNNVFLTVGAGQLIGTVTSSFKPDQITVTFKV
ncbi:hypothetical protein JLT2_72 [Paraglaciecola Antarctic JLT virus 2]|nr:hypothetical protein JLT2_72 [Paraglaciecola Antarctic JLT virus 2]